MIKDPWARASISKNGASYLTIMNHGKHPEKLIGVMAPVAKRVELHTHKNDNGVMRMRDELREVAPGMLLGLGSMKATGGARNCAPFVLVRVADAPAVEPASD